MSREPGPVHGDARGLDALLSAWTAGWKPAIVGDALRAMGTVALSQLVLLLETRPDLVGRKAALDILKQAPPTDVLEVLQAPPRSDPSTTSLIRR